MNIFFVRHAQSQSNVDVNVLKLQTNVSVNLSEIGLAQGKETGEFLSEFLTSANLEKDGIKVWNSPYERTRQTSQIIKDVFTNKSLNFTEEESIYISERQFGLVDDVHEYDKHYAHESKHYKLHKEHKHDFFARPPLGESPYDMCMRLDFFLRTVLNNESEIKNHIVVSHGAAIRGLILMHQKQKYEEYNCPNPANASVRMVQGQIYKGEIFCPTEKTF